MPPLTSGPMGKDVERAIATHEIAQAAEHRTSRIGAAMPGQQNQKNVVRQIFTAITVGVIAVGVANAGPDTKRLDDNLTFELKRAESWGDMDDPSKDGWQTEVFSAAAKKQLDRLVKLFLSPDALETQDVKPFAAPQVSCWPLHPDKLETVFKDRSLHVKRAQVDMEAIRTRQSGRFAGHDGLAHAMRQLVQPFLKARDRRFQIKVINVEAAGDAVTTRQHFSISARTDGGVLEQHATWVIEWSGRITASAPRIAWIGVEEFEQIQGLENIESLFSDCTESVLAGNPSYTDQLMRGYSHWLERTSTRRYFFSLGNPGLALGDVNGDGLEDLYVCQEAGLPNRLYVQDPNGTVRDISHEAGIDWLHSSRSALLVDLDNDGDQDLAVAIDGGVILAAGDGHGRFTMKTVLDTSDDTMSLAAADYNRDGRLDLYVCAYYDESAMGGAAIAAAEDNFVFHDANSGGVNTLFRNDLSDDDWRFTNVTSQVGLGMNNRRFSFAAAWEDYDNDGDLDLYVANDFGRDNLFRCDAADGSRFVDVGASVGAEDSAGGMGLTWADYDQNGWMDVFVSNMWSAAGRRIAFQQQFKADAPLEVKRRIQRFARGNTLLKNLGNGTFVDESALAGVEMGRWAWGSHFIDINNDGWEDLIVANGYITTADTGDL